MFYETSKNDHGLAHPPFKSCAVPRCIGWLSTISADGIPNLAPFSQFTNLTFDPPYVLVSINRSPQGIRKDTTVNIEATREFVYNIVPYDLREAMNITAGHYPPEADEFELSGLTKAKCEMVKPYRVGESPINLECKYVQTIVLPGDSLSGTVDIIIGKVVGIHIADDVILPDGKIDMLKIKPLARMGYADYTCADRIFELKTVDIEGMNLGLEGATGLVP